MNPSEAKRIGRIKVLKATGVIFAFLILLTIIANLGKNSGSGMPPTAVLVVFVIQSIISIAILFSMTYMFGSKAGEEIMIRKKNFLLVSVKYVTLISFAIAFYYTIVWILNGSYGGPNLQGVFKQTFVPMFMKTAFVLLIGWIYSTYKMKAIIEKE